MPLTGIIFAPHKPHKMKVYYYHTSDIQTILKGWRQGTFPGHFLYGATHLDRHGIGVVWHRFHYFRHRWQQTLYATWRVLTCRERFDAIYATTFRGLELIIMLRAVGLFRRPVCVWHHQPVVKAKSRVREAVARLFYRGIDHMFLFSDKLVADSLLSVKARPERMSVARWGADLDYYDRLLGQADTTHRKGFISTGKENRDMPTLVKAFNHTGSDLDIYVCRAYGGIDYERLFADMQVRPNIHIHYITGLAHREMSLRVNASACVVICCRETNYTVGLTTVVEALALGLPLICSRNPQMPVDIDRVGCGMAVDYYDEEGWRKAVDRLQTHPDETAAMGRRGREYAREVLNLDNCAQDVATVLKRWQRPAYASCHGKRS